MKQARVTLDQWRALHAVVDQGGYAQGAAFLHRSQSSISHAIARLQKQLGTDVLQIEGRKAKLTAAGKILLRHSRQLVNDAIELEHIAKNLGQGWEAEIQLVVDAAFPSSQLMAALKQFALIGRGTHIQLHEAVLSGADEAIRENRADLVIGNTIPQGYPGEHLIEVEFIAVAHKNHALHQLEHVLTTTDLRRETQVVTRDSGTQRPRDAGWLGAEHRWTVSSIDKAVIAVSNGLGFAWLPRHQIAKQLASGTLLPLPLRENQTRLEQLYLIFGHAEHSGPATRKLAALLRQQCTNNRRKRAGQKIDRHDKHQGKRTKQLQ